MKRLACEFMVFIFAAGVVWAQSGIQFVKPKTENLRNAPNGSKIGELSGGMKVEVLERRVNWVKVQVTGWIWDKSLTVDSTQVEGFKLRASHILVSTEQEANQVLQELRAGTAFEELARKYSKDPSSAANGGDVGEFGRGDFVPEFEQAVFRLKPGETSGAVKTALGFHIIKRTR
jgi:hypothetical protein